MTALRITSESADLRHAFRRLRLPDGDDRSAAIREFQRRAGLRADGTLDEQTLARMNAELEHRYYADSKTRVARIHRLLERTGAQIDPAELRSRTLGDSSTAALRRFAASSAGQGQTLSDDLIGRLENVAHDARLQSKTQVGHIQRTLLRALSVAKLEVIIDSGELKRKTLGTTCRAAIRAFQDKYELPATGELDPLTLRRLETVATSRPRPPRSLKPSDRTSLAPVTRTLRLNMANQYVAGLQQALAYLGQSVAEKEFKTATFGPTTRRAVIAFQKDAGLPMTGHVDGETRRVLNFRIVAANPDAATTTFGYRIRGSVRDASGAGRQGLRVQVWEKVLRGEGRLLAERPSQAGGFFDIPYPPPADPVNGRVATPFHLSVRVLGPGDAELGRKVVFNPTQVAWVNFNEGSQPYRGTSEFDERMRLVSRVLGTVPLTALEETESDPDITHVSVNTGLTRDDVMRLVLAARVAADLGDAAVGPAVVYAYVRQNLPASLPGDLLGSTVKWTLIDHLVELTGGGLVFLDPDLQEAVFDNAVSENLVPLGLAGTKSAVLAGLARLRESFVLEKPILVGNGSVKQLLEASSIGAAHYPAVAAAFLTHRSFGEAFWADAHSRPGDFGGTAALDDFEITVRLGEITKNFAPTAGQLKTLINGPQPRLTAVRDLAKLDHSDWVDVLNEGGGQVPPGTDGETAAERTATYAATLQAQSERLYPTVALVARARSGDNQLTHLDEIETLTDASQDLDMRVVNIDAFVARSALTVEPEVLGEMKVLQRVSRIAPGAADARLLLDQGIHSAFQVLSMGKEGLVRRLAAAEVDQAAALTIFATAEFRYAQAINKLVDYRSELNQATPRAIVPYTYTAEELATFSAGVPTLEELFGPADTCACSSCQSVLGPPAYLADLLRFLDAQPSQTAGLSVRKVLLERRPDLGNLLLGCDNTTVALPYVDLVNEVLEALVTPADPDTSFQTTLSATELRAFPENVRRDAYDLIRIADFPMRSSFDLWQEETRTFLAHLGVPRHELMDLMSGAPGLSGSGEYWGMSSHETELVSTAEPTADRQLELWGFSGAALPDTVGVRTFLERAGIRYAELLELAHVAWISPPGDPQRLTVARPADTSSLGAQTVTHLSAANLDKAHRFLRLWRHTPWQMWELDRLIRSPKIGNGTLDATAVIRLHQVRRLQKRLGLDVEQVLGLLGNIGTTARTIPDTPDKQIRSHYDSLFQNKLLINPVDPAFALPIAGNPVLADHRPALVAAFAITDTDLGALLPRTDGTLTVANLSKLLGYVLLARGLALTVPDLLTLLDLAGIADPVASVQSCDDVVAAYDTVSAGRLSIGELDYLLALRPGSPYGLRDDVIVQGLEAVRESLRSNPALDPDGQIIASVAGAFSLTDEQSAVLLRKLTVGGLLLGLFKDARLGELTSDGSYAHPVDETTFGDLFTAYRLLHKAALVASRHRLSDGGQLGWLIDHAEAAGVLSLGALPVKVAPPAPLFDRWVGLRELTDFRDAYPEPEGADIIGILELARTPGFDRDDLHAALAALTGWKQSDVATFHTGLGFDDADYLDPATYTRLRSAFRALSRLGVDARQTLDWARRDHDASQFTTAQQVRQAAKARYDERAWLTTATPLMDKLREAKRDGLVGWLVENSQRTEPEHITVGGKQFANPRRWAGADDLLAWVLIDVEMSSCQLTSRIKQAISSTQTFVQRCFLNLEPAFVQVSRDALADEVSLDSWRQWKWMKSYRIWEANRKVFLYPENWLEPDLRDDKSPFFTDLESELLQSELTTDLAEQAYVHYLEKVHEVARLEITGIYYEVDDDTPYDNTPPNINRLHVVGRTRGHPATYYYRCFDLVDGAWTPWEQIDLEISGDQVIPVVYNRRLYLFWLVITEKPQKIRKQPAAAASSKPTTTPDPANQLEIQLAWSQQTRDGWTAKRLSRERLVHPWQRPHSAYNLKPRYKPRENQLWLDLYLSTTAGFNNGVFYDHYAGAPTRVTATRFDESIRPWHSSSFVFDGNVVDLRMKGLTGKYRLQGVSGVMSDNPVDTNSYEYVRNTLGPDGAAIRPLTGGYQVAPRLALPSGMHFENAVLRNNSRTANPSTLSVVEGAASVSLLQGARSPFELVFSQHAIQFDEAVSNPAPMVYQDPQRSFFIRPEWREVMVGYNQILQLLQYTFSPLYHPYTSLFLREIKRSGLEGLLNRKIQISPQSFYPGSSYRFTDYAPTTASQPAATASKDVVDFDRSGAYSVYNWEAFFHIPLMIAARLSSNQRFEEAMRWFHFVFDPTNTEALSTPQRFWVTKPFYEQNSEDYRKQRIEALLDHISDNTEQLTAWKNNPFDPHLIARFRPVAYQKNVVMRYIDNLVAWGDQLMRQETIEAINEATTLYLLASELLGPRPEQIPDIARRDRSYNDLTADGPLDPFGNTKVEVLMENLADSPVQVVRTNDGTEPMPVLEVSYFGIMPNDALLGYWDRVADRLFKVRNCMNLSGVVRQLPLFEPPIDPALLVKAAAAGIDLGSVLSGAGAPASEYRCKVLIQKAQELTTEVRALGDKILGALEKLDAEELSLIRSTHEVAMLRAVKQLRADQLALTEDERAALERAQETAQTKFDYYTGREYLNAGETVALSLNGVSALAQTAIAVGYSLAGGLALIPAFTIGASGFGGSPVASAEIPDGIKFSKAAECAVSTLGAIASAADKWAGMASTLGGYQRRADEWDFQGRLASIELDQIQKQLDAAALRISIAQKELDNHDLQTTQSEAVDEYLRGKYTNHQLYDWMVKQLSTVYFQCYQLAFDMAKRAETAMQYELGRSDRSFIEFGYWDGLKKGLLAGERLANDLRRMEAAWYEHDTRRLELTKHISLAQIDPLALVRLEQTGGCDIVLPEWLFDRDHPGHFRRRIQTVSLSIPCVVGPYTSVNATLSLTNHGTRVTEDLTGGYGDPLVPDSPRFAKVTVPVQAIATSSGQDDSGLFELSFGDERLLPFEGAGAVSTWRLDLPAEDNAFDLDTISDVVMHLRYTAMAGSTGLVQAARTNRASVVPSHGVRLFVLDHEFGSQWQRFLAPPPEADQELAFVVGRQHLPFAARTATNVRLNRVDLIVGSDHAGDFEVQLTLPGAAEPSTDTMSPDDDMADTHHLIKDPVTPPRSALGTWSLKIRKAGVTDFRSLVAADLKGAYLIVAFTTS